MQVSDVVGPVAIAQHQIGRAARPCQHVSLVAARAARATLTIHLAATLQTLVMP